MVISWYGQSCFKIQSGETIAVIDPFDKKIGLTPPRQIGADLILVTHHHYDHDNVAAVAGSPFIIDGPGEYEVRGIKILGVFSFHDNNEGKERGTNTIYLIDWEGLRLCHLGDLGQAALNDEQLDLLDEVDILMAPVGGKFTIDAEEAAKIIKQIEPKIVIPMHYKISGLAIDLDPLDKFLKELGLAEKEAAGKLTIKKKDLPVEGMEVAVMKV